MRSAEAFYNVFMYFYNNMPENPFQNYELAKNYLKYNRNFSFLKIF